MDNQPIEQKIAQQCQIILSTEAEHWEIRNKAILQLTSIISQLDIDTPSSHHLQVLPTIFKTLKEPVQSMILDLRSQQVRDACQFLMKLSEVTRDNLRTFMREFFPIFQEALRVSNKVISIYIDECIHSLIKQSTFKSCLPLLGNDIKENKSKAVREHCIEYVNEILLHWDITEKDADQICEIVRIGLQDASMRVREVARLAYLNLFGSFPKKVEKIKANLPTSVSSRLIKAEQNFLKAKEITLSVTVNPRMSPSNKPSPKSQSAKAKDLISNFIPENERIISSAEPIISPRSGAPELGFRAPKRQSDEMFAVTKIQAMFRGSLVRRQSGGLPRTPIKESPKKTKEANTASSSRASTPSRRPSTRSNISSRSSTPSKARQTSTSSYSPTSGNMRDDASLEMNSEFGYHIPEKFTSSPKDGVTTDGSHLSIGMTVEVRGRDVPTRGIVRFIGRTLFNADGYWVGIHLTEPTGKNDGSVQGVKYFLCEENHGLFVRPQTVYPLNFAEFSGSTASPSRKPSLSIKTSVDSHGNGSIGNGTVSTGTTTSTTGTKSSTSSPRSALSNLTKLKISLTMDLLQQQLECIERIERSSLSSHQSDDEKLLKSLVQQEKELWEKYSEKLSKLK